MTNLRKNFIPVNCLPYLQKKQGGFSKPILSKKMIQKAIELLEYNLQKSGVFDMQKMKRLREMKENL